MNKKLISFLTLASLIGVTLLPITAAMASEEEPEMPCPCAGDFRPMPEERPINSKPAEGMSDRNPLPPRQEPPAGFEDEVMTVFTSNPFSDTNINELSGKAAAELYRRAVIGGYPDGEFKGGKPVNRAEAAKFLLLSRFGEVGEVANNGQFNDVLDGQWYTKYVVTAATKGIIKGYQDGSFKPADTVNTAEFLKMLTITFDLEQNLPHSYQDVSDDQWFAPYAGVAAQYQLFPQRGSKLLPGQPMTRAEVAIAIYQFLANRESK